MKQTMKTQRGLSLTGMLFFLGLAIFFVVLGLKLGPHYMEYLTVRSAMQDLKEQREPGLENRQSILNNINKRLYINEVRDVDPKAFEYKKVKGGYSLSVDYIKQEHLFGNMDVLMHFTHEVQVDRQ